MRLIRDAELPARLVTLNRLQFMHGLAVVAVACAIWLPAPAVAEPWLPAITDLVALYLLFQVGVYVGAEQARDAATLVPAAVPLALAGAVALLVTPAVAAPLLALAVLFLFVLEKVSAIREHWPAAWQRGRRQHMQFQMVALASVLFWLFSRDNQALLRHLHG